MPQKLTTEVALKNLKSWLPDYQFLNVNITEGNKTPITFICPENHTSTIPYSKFQQGRICPICSRNNGHKKQADALRGRIPNNLKPLEIVKSELESMDLGLELDFSNYQNTQSTINATCIYCGLVFQTYYHYLKSKKGRGCSSCSNYRKLSLSEMKNNTLKHNPNIDLSDWQPKNSKDKSKVTCKVCGNSWKQYYGILKAHGCPICSHKNKSYTQEQAIQLLVEARPDLDFSEFKYDNYSTKSKVTCKICSHSWLSSYNNLKKSKSCPVCYSDKCKERQLLTSTKVKEKVKSKFPNIEYHCDGYIGQYTKYPYTCTKCGFEGQSSYNNLYHNECACPNCNRVSELHSRSKPETEIINEIQFLFPELEVQQSNRSIVKSPQSDRYLELDIYIPELKFAIEFNGDYWHSDETIQKRTKGKFSTAKDYHDYKSSLCKAEGVKLLHIQEAEYLSDRYGILSFIITIIKTRLQVVELLKQLNIDYETEVTLHGYKVDYLIQNVALDISYNIERNHKTIPKKYHSLRTSILSKNNIRLINLFENHLKTPRMWFVLQDIISHALGKSGKKYQARKLKLEVRPAKEIKPFYQENNIQGYRNANTAFVLSDPETNEVIMAYSVGKAYFGKGKYDAEIARGACKLGCSVVGGASKLWSAIIEYYKDKDIYGNKGSINSIVYYVDLNYYNGQSMRFLKGQKFVTEQAGFWNYWVEVDELRNREPAKHAQIMQFMFEGKILSIPNSGTQVNVWTRE